MGEIGEVNQDLQRSDHIVLNDDLEYSGDALSDIQEEEEKSFIEQQNGQSLNYDQLACGQDSPLKIRLRHFSSHNGDSWLEELSSKFEHRYILLIFVSYFSLGTKILTDVALKEMFIGFYGVEINSMVNLTWTFRIIYGILADNICILSLLGLKGSSKRLYLIILGAVNLITIFMIFFWKGSQD